MTLSVLKMQMCPAYRSWIWSICDRLSLSHLRDFIQILTWAVAEQLKDVSYSLSDGNHLQPLSHDYSYRPWHDFAPSAFEFLAETFCWSMMKLPAAARRADVITGQKRYFSRGRNSTNTCNLSLSLFLTYEAISGSNQLHIHNLFHLHIALLLNLLSMSPHLCL